jgi:hypothetical protein
MSTRILEVVNTREEFNRAQDAGQPCLLALTYRDPLTGPSGEYLVLLYSWDSQNGDQWAMYSGPHVLMQRSELHVEGEWNSDTELVLAIKADLDFTVDSLYLDPNERELTLDFPEMSGVVWQRVDSHNYVFEVDDDTGTMRLSQR